MAELVGDWATFTVKASGSNYYWIRITTGAELAENPEAVSDHLAVVEIRARQLHSQDYAWSGLTVKVGTGGLESLKGQGFTDQVWKKLEAKLFKILLNNKPNAVGNNYTEHNGIIYPTYRTAQKINKEAESI